MNRWATYRPAHCCVLEPSTPVKWPIQPELTPVSIACTTRNITGAILHWVSKVFRNCYGFCFLSLCDWSRKLALFSQPIRFKTKTNPNLVTHGFPRVSGVEGGFAPECKRRNTKNKVQATHLKWKVFKLLLHLSQMTDSQHCFVPKVHVKNLRTRVKANRCWVSACSSTLNTTSSINNYSPKRRWPEVDICRAEKREDKYSPAIDTEVNSWFNIHLVCRSNIFDSL